MDNTVDTIDTMKSGNTKQISRGRKWVFTLNNWTDEEYEIIKNESDTNSQYFCIGKEIGKEGTKHLQGYLEYKNAVSFNRLKGILPKAHIEKAVGSREQNLKYCSKDGNFITNIKITVIKCLAKENLYEWQKELIEILEKEPDDRKIYWYWDEEGNKGKSAMARYLAIKMDALVVSGTCADVKYTVANCKEYPRIIIWDLSRYNAGNLSYAGLEDVKNGLFCSNKYESKMVIGNPPHIVVFANSEPHYEMLSKDRLIIKNL